MMSSLMSIFDPSMSLPYFGWSVVIISVLVLKAVVFWNTPSLTFLSLKNFIVILLSLLTSYKIVFTTLFFFILNMNLMGLLPLVFSPTSHLNFNLCISLTLWLGMMIWYLKGNLNQFLVHLTPLGCPIGLAPALALIELTSSLIRPVTLGLRLMANIMAGHMILTLISKGIFALPVPLKLFLFPVLTGFMMFEFGVALIQAYVFSSLMMLYWEESSETSH